MNNATNSNDGSMRSRRESGAGDGIRQRVEHARDIVETLRDKAEVAFREKPYLLPVTTGAVGFGLGLLLGSKVTRFLLFTAVGTLLSDALGGEIKRISRDFMDNLQERLDVREQLEEGETAHSE
jgi:hypothetical protein